LRRELARRQRSKRGRSFRHRDKTAERTRERLGLVRAVEPFRPFNGKTDQEGGQPNQDRPQSGTPQNASHPRPNYPFIRKTPLPPAPSVDLRSRKTTLQLRQEIGSIRLGIDGAPLAGSWLGISKFFATFRRGGPGAMLEFPQALRYDGTAEGRKRQTYG